LYHHVEEKNIDLLQRRWDSSFRGQIDNNFFSQPLNRSWDKKNCN